MAIDIPMNTLEHVVYSGTELNAIDVDGCKWRKPYTATIPSTPTGVSGLAIFRAESESNCGQLTDTTVSATGPILYGDTISPGFGGSPGKYEITAAVFSGGVSTVTTPVTRGRSFKSLYFDTTVTPDLYSNLGCWIETDTRTFFYEYNGEITEITVSNGLLAENIQDPPQCELVWSQYDFLKDSSGNILYENPDGIIMPQMIITRTVVYREYSEAYTNSGKPTGWLVDHLDFAQGYTVNYIEHADAWQNFISMDAGKVTGDVTMTVQTPSGVPSFVHYLKGTATSGTLPSRQSRIYPNAVTLGTNSMSKSATTVSSYAVTFNANGGSCSTSSLTATKKRNYTRNGWTTTSGSTTRTYTNGATFGKNNATNLTLYPCFSQSTSGGSITLPTPTRTGYIFKGWATSSTATSGSTGSYTPTGNTTLYATWQVTAYTLTMSTITGVTNQVVMREASPYANAACDELYDGDTIYYGDVLSLYATAEQPYTEPSVTRDITVTGNIATADFITTGTIVTSLVAPVLGSASWSGNAVRFQVTNNNPHHVNLLIILTDQDDNQVTGTKLRIAPNATVWATSPEMSSAQYGTLDVTFSWMKLIDGSIKGVAASEVTSKLVPRYTLKSPVVVSTSFNTNYDYDTYRYKYLGYVTIRNDNTVPVHAETTWTCSNGSIISLDNALDIYSIPAGGTEKLACNTTDTGATVTVYFYPKPANTYYNSDSVSANCGEVESGGDT